MSDPERVVSADIAGLAAAIERAAADLAVAEEPAGLVVALEGESDLGERGDKPTYGPALAMPCGLSSDSRPLALQIVGRAFDEATVLRIGHAYQRVTAWHLEPPRFSGRGGPVIG